jgi:hypothetical protein
MLNGFAGSGLLGLTAATSNVVDDADVEGAGESCADAVVAASKMTRRHAQVERIMFISLSGSASKGIVIRDARD